MTVYNKYINLNKKLAIIIKLTILSYREQNNFLVRKQFLNEIYFYNSLDIQELNYFINILESLYHPNEVISLFTDITKGIKDEHIERINFILHEEYYNYIKCNNTNSLNKELFNSLKTIFACVNTFEFQIRNIYFQLLDDHIKSSNGMTKEYLDYLNNLQNKIKFKYPNNWYRNILIDIKDYDYNNFFNDYLNSNIEKTIREILKVKNEDFNDESVYAKIISLQIYLRSLLIMLDNEFEMIKYEELYNALEPNNTTAKTIVRNAFIANYLDTKNKKYLMRGEAHEKK